MSVIVDDGFVRVGRKSYAINKINSVEVRSRQVRGKGLALAAALIAVLCLLVALGAVRTNGSPAGGLIAAAVFGGIAWLLSRRPDIYEHELFLMTSSSEMSGYKTRDQGEIDALRAQIEGAMLAEARAGR